MICPRYNLDNLGYIENISLTMIILNRLSIFQFSVQLLTVYLSTPFNFAPLSDV